MSYQLATKNNEENYGNINEDRKLKIMKELQEDMKNLKYKYLLEDKKKNPTEINELESITITNRNASNRYQQNIDQNQMLEREESILDNQSPVVESDSFMQKEKDPSEDENEIQFSNDEDLHLNNQYLPSEIKDSDYKNNSKSNENKSDSYFEKDKQNYQVFDKAKENLMKIRNELDDLDKYDYQKNKNFIKEKWQENQIIYPKNNIADSMEKEEMIMDDYIEEEQPKNFEEEISMSMKEDSQYNINLNQSNSQYKFNPQYVNSVSNGFNFQMIPLAEQDYRGNKNTNNFIPTSHRSNVYSGKPRNSSLNKNHKKVNLGLTNDRKSLTKNKSQVFNTNTKFNESTSDSKEKRKMSPYFKKMVKEYNPKYKQAKTRDRFEKLKSEIEDKFQKEHTFKPNTNYANVFQSVEKYNESKEEVYKRLSTPKIVELNKKLKENASKTSKKIEEDCPFKPNIINKKSQNNLIEVNDTRKENDPEKVANRLYKLAEQMKEKREKLKREQQDNLIKDYSFTPLLNENSKQLMLKYENRPLHERYEEIVNIKKQNLHNLRIYSENQEKGYYKPEINSKSKDLIMRKSDRSFNGDQSIHERLYREGLDQKNRRVAKDILEAEQQQCTFSPNLYYSTAQPEGNIEDFLERQKIYEEIKKERAERAFSKSKEQNIYTFKPKINLTSDILMKADHNRANEDIKEKVTRLYKDDFEKMKQRKNQLEELYYAQYDFKPKINEISRFVGKDNKVDDLYQKPESSKIRKYREERIRSETDGCTFKPQINRDKYDNIQSAYKADDQILKRIQSEVKYKNEKIEEIKNLMNEQSLQECKFQPEINKEVPNYDVKEPIVMKGFAKYLDQMEKARKAKRDKEEREKEVFISGENWSRDNLITIPKPFNLSYQKVLKENKDDLSKKRMDSELKECTFKPATNESKNKEIIKMILKN